MDTSTSTSRLDTIHAIEQRQAAIHEQRQAASEMGMELLAMMEQLTAADDAVSELLWSASELLSAVRCKLRDAEHICTHEILTIVNARG